jgi:hypothetical protein
MAYDPLSGELTQATTACFMCEGPGMVSVDLYAPPRATPRRSRTCAGCNDRFLGQDLIEVGDDHLTFFEGDELCRPCARAHGVL